MITSNRQSISLQLNNQKNILVSQLKFADSKLQKNQFSNQRSMKNKNSDSDYKAEDEGSASEQAFAPGKKGKKKPLSLKLTKKEIIENAIKNFIPEGILFDKKYEISMGDYEQLLKAENIKEFSLNYKTFLGKVVHVTDGDTVKIVIKINGELSKFTFRLNGIDTPETRKGDVREFGKYVKQVVKEMIQDKIVKVQAGDFDKYGRVLSRIYAYSDGDEFCINDFLIENDMAKQYTGKTKTQFTKRDYEDFKQKYDEKAWPKVENYPI